MSFSCSRSVIGLTSKLFKQHNILPKLYRGHGVMSNVCRVAQSQRTMTRSLSLMSRGPEHERFPVTGEKIAKWTNRCGCCGLHTDGDKEIGEFLVEEIKYEKKTEKKTLPNIRGFEVTTAEGTNVELTQKVDGETVVVKFNVNNTIDEDLPVEFKEAANNPDDDTQMVSRPPFIVEINKGRGETLAIQCAFPRGALGEETAEGEYEDLIEIEEVALLADGQKWEESVYTLQGANMDGNLYDMTLNMLEERGVTESFINELVEFSTAFEHKKYIGFLENLKKFVS